MLRRVKNLVAVIFFVLAGFVGGFYISIIGFPTKVLETGKLSDLWPWGSLYVLHPVVYLIVIVFLVGMAVLLVVRDRK